MKKYAAPVLLSLAVLLLAACSVGDKTIMLRFKFEPGMKLIYQQTSNRQIQLRSKDSVLTDRSYTFDMVIEQKVQDMRADSIAEILETDSWEYVRPAPNDSAHADTVRKSRELLMDIYPNGRITNLRSATGEDVRHLSYIKNFYEQGVPVFPSGELSPGYSWTQTTKVILPDETMEASTTYKIKSLVREGGYDCAVIESDGNLVIPIEPGPSDTTLISGVDHITTTGLIYFAYREGIIVEQRERWVVDGTRVEMHNGEERTVQLASETDVDFALDSYTKP